MSGFVFIPEEIVALSQFLVLTMGRINGFESIGVVACIEHLGGHRHGRRREVLNLLKPVAHLLHIESQLGHILKTAARVAADEVRDELVTQACLFAYFVEAALGLAENAEGWLAHERQHMVGCMLRSHFEAAGGVVDNHLAEVLPATVIVCKKVAPDTAADVEVLNLGVVCNLLQ